MTREQQILDWLHSPAVRLYSTEERQAHQIDRAQTNDERKYANRHMSGAPLRERLDYRAPVVPRTAEKTEAILEKLARKGSRPYRRTDPLYPGEPLCDWNKLAKDLDRKFAGK